MGPEEGTIYAYAKAVVGVDQPTCTIISITLFKKPARIAKGNN